MFNPNLVSWKQMQNLDLVFIQMSLFINFIYTNVIKMSLCCFINFSLWNYGLWIAKTNCLKFPLTLSHHRPSWIQWIWLRSFFMVSRIWIWFQKIWPTNATEFKTGFSFHKAPFVLTLYMSTTNSSHNHLLQLYIEAASLVIVYKNMTFNAWLITST